MGRLLLAGFLVLSLAACGRHPPPPEAPAAVVPNLPIINPARPVTEEALKALEEDFRQAAREAVVPFAGAGAEAGQDLLDARVVRLFSQEKVLWVEVRLGRWWHSLDAKSQDEVLARLGRLLYSLDEKAFNQKRDVILTAKDTKGRRLGDVTVTPFSTNVRLASPPAKKNKPSS